MLSPQELGLLQDYLLALTTDDHLLRCAAQVLSLPVELAGCLPVAGCPYHSGQEKSLCACGMSTEATQGLHGALFQFSRFLLVSESN